MKIVIQLTIRGLIAHALYANLLALTVITYQHLLSTEGAY